MEYTTKEIGNKGEDFACSYLEQLGHEILCRNYREKTGEIDVITYKYPRIHFIEVKTVWMGMSKNIDFDSDIMFGLAQRIDLKKMTNIEKTAQKFMFEHGLEEEASQFDLVMVAVFDGGYRYRLEILENINID